MPMTSRGWALLCFLSVLWGGAFFFVAVAVDQVPPLTLVFCRVVLAATCLVGALWLAGSLPPLRARLVAAFFVMGALNNVVPFSLLFWAQTNISSGLTAILNATTPIFALIVAHLFLDDERLSRGKVAGIGFGIAGVAALSMEDLMGGVDARALAIAACLGAALSYGLAGVFGRRFGKVGIPSVAVACGQLTASAVIMTPIVMAVERPWTLPVPGAAAIVAIVLLAVVSTALAYIVFFHLLATVGAGNVTLVTLLIPVSAIVLGATFLGERLEPHHYLGMGLIAVGLLMIDGRLFGTTRTAPGE